MKKIGILLGLCLGLLLSSIAQSWEGSRPNIVFILADDLGYGDLSCYGQRQYQTPELDKLAGQGMRFTRFYSMNTICSPSRAGLLTGLNPIRLGIQDVFFPESFTGMPTQVPTIAHLLKGVGYNTACIGKWHLGHHARYLPKSRGFDYYYGLPYSNDMANLTLLENDSVVEEHVENRLLTSRYTQKTLDWLGQQQAGKPFFLYLAHNMPHIPLGVSKEFEGKSGFTLYGDVMLELDHSVGQIRKLLEQKGLSQNTIIVFTSDNGPWLVYGPNGGTAGPLRGGKQTSYEGGIRVPCLVYWPGKITQGLVQPAMATMADWLETLARWGGVQASALPRTDGQNLEPLLKGKKSAAPREYASYYVGQLEAYIYGDWKIHLPKKGQENSKYKLAEPQTDWQLYNLENDPSESKNLAESQPQKLQEMKDRLADYQKRTTPLPKKIIAR